MNQSAEVPRFLARLGDELDAVAGREARRLSARSRFHGGRAMILALVAVVALGGGAGVATGIVSLPGDGPNFVAQDSTGAFDADLAKSVSVLATPRDANDSMAGAEAYVTATDGPAPSSSLRVVPPAPTTGTPHATASKYPVWLLPVSSGKVSMQILPTGATGPASGFSADLNMIEVGHARMTVGPELAGIVPDGVSTVDITFQDGTRASLPVANNIYGARLDAPIAAITFQGIKAP